MDNTSGRGAASVVPAEIDRWNWGAFFLNWIWGIGNSTWLALLMFVPGVNLAMPFVLGAKGSAWAWRNRRWESIGHFRAAQRAWALWGVGALASVLLLFGALFFTVVTAMKHSTAYQLTLSAMHSSQAVVQELGTPIHTGVPSGSIRMEGPDGEAHLSFSASGPSGSGTVYVRAVRAMGQWRIDTAVLEEDDTRQRIDFTPGTARPTSI